MDYVKAFSEKENKLLHNMSMGPGLYQLDAGLKTGTTVHPFAPGSYISRESQGVQPELIDIQSDLNNLTRRLTGDISKHYTPESNNVRPKKIHGKDGFFSQNSTRMSDPAFDLKEFGINRWEQLDIDPQANAIEPFQREGLNTVLNVLDSHKPLCK